MKFEPPAPRYAGPSYRRSDGQNKPIRRVVIHSTVSPCVPGGAETIARYFRSSAAGGSAHYVTDPTTTLQTAYDSVICWHAPPNAGSLGIEMCDMPTTVNAKRWADENHRLMLDRTAKLTAQLCLAYGVPIRFRGPLALRLGRRGITTHANVSAAWGQSSHWDPGAWPRRRFMRLVRAHAAMIRKAAAA